MIRRTFAYLRGLPAMFVDGAIYVMLAVMTANAMMLTSDEAKEFVGRQLLFYITWSNSLLNSGLLALKMYRSTGFADHKQQVKDETNFIARNPPKV